MTLQTVLAWSIFRSLIIAALAMPLSVCVCRFLQSIHSSSRRVSPTGAWRPQNRISGRAALLMAVALLPLFVPDLLTGFSYRLTATRLIHSATATECLYGTLLLCRVIALQIAVHLVMPAAPISKESLHSWKLVPQRDWTWWTAWLRMRMLGPNRTMLIAFIAGAVLCFQDFETAALLQVDRHPITFTVWLFDAHSAGEPLTHSLRFVTGSVLFQLALILPTIALLTVRQKQKASQPLSQHMQKNGHGVQTSGSSIVRFPALAVIAVGLWVVFVWPAMSNLGSIQEGLAGLFQQGTLARRVVQIFVSLTATTASASLALLIARLLRRLNSRWLTLAALLPGLCGSLVLSILLLAFFQLPLFNVVYDSWVPMLAGATLLMLPRAFLLVFLLEISSAITTQHSAQLLTTGDADHLSTGRQLLWRLVQSRWLLALAMLTHWAFWDVTVASVLRPVRFEPVVTRLYNEMHYGRTESLVAMTFLALLLPLLILSLTAALLQFRPYMKKVLS